MSSKTRSFKILSENAYLSIFCQDSVNKNNYHARSCQKGVSFQHSVKNGHLSTFCQKMVILYDNYLKSTGIDRVILLSLCVNAHKPGPFCRNNQIQLLTSVSLNEKAFKRTVKFPKNRKLHSMNNISKIELRLSTSSKLQLH